MGASWSSSSTVTMDRMKEKAIANLQRAWVKLAPSSVEGIGVFALRDIPEGVEVLRWDWLRYESVFIPEEQLRTQVPPEVFDQLRRIWHVDQNGLIATPVDFSATLSYINFLNHSDQPNLRFRYSDGGYITLRQVAAGEELCISYDKDYYPGYTDAFKDKTTER